MDSVNLVLIKTAREKFPASDMFLMRELRHRYQKEKPFLGKKIVFNAHLTMSTLTQIEVLLSAGADLLVTLSDNLMVDEEAVGIIRRANIPVVRTDELSDYACFAALDCCGGLSGRMKPEVGVAELTRTGIPLYEKDEIPVVSVDDAEVKKLETYIGTADGFIRAFRVLTKHGVSHKQFIIFGYGKVGKGIVKVLLELDARVMVVDKEPKKIEQAKFDNVPAMLLSNCKNHLKDAFAVITATGVSHAISSAGLQREDFADAILVNMGSEDEWGENFSSHDVLFAKRPVNFYLKEPTRIKFLDPVFTAQILAIEDLMKQPRKAGVYPFSREYDLELLLQWTLHYYRPKVKGDFLENIIANIPAFIYWKDQSLVYQGCNARFADAAGGGDPNNIIGKTDFDLVWGNSEANIYRKDDERVLAGEKLLDFEETQLQNDGKKTTVLASKVPYYDEEGNIVGVLGVYSDITERKQKEVELAHAKAKAEAANQLKTDFLAITSHELRTPMAAMLGIVDLLNEPMSSDKGHEYLNLLQQQGNQLLDIINNILNFSKIEAEKYVLSKQMIDLNTLIASVTTIYKHSAKEKGLKFKLETDDALPQVFVDQTVLQQIISNLITNAIKFTHDGSVGLTVRIREKKDDLLTLEFIVEDTGLGMDAEQQKIIFERFRQIEEPERRQQMGVGLGLSIVKQFVDMLDGEITVESTVNKGSKFTVILTLEYLYTKEEQTKEVLDPMTMEQFKNNRVLLVEDDKIVAMVHTQLLKKLELDVTHAENAKMALQYLQDKNYDVLLLDLGLPDISGLDVIRIVRQELKLTVPIIVLTAFIDNQSNQSAQQAGANQVLAKPVDKLQLASVLSQYFSKCENDS